MLTIPLRCVATDRIVDSVFNETFSAMTTVILTPKNDASLNLNKQVLKVKHTYYSTDRILTDDEEKSKNYPSIV